MNYAMNFLKEAARQRILLRLKITVKKLQSLKDFSTSFRLYVHWEKMRKILIFASLILFHF